MNEDQYDDVPRRERPHYVYRIFDKDGRLLYIGCTEQVDQRIYMHRATYTLACAWEIHEWYDHHTSEELPTLAAARAAERAAIKAEAPLLNRQHNPKRWSRVNGEYLPTEGTIEALRQVDTDHAPSPEDVATMQKLMALLGKWEKAS